MDDRNEVASCVSRKGGRGRGRVGKGAASQGAVQKQTRLQMFSPSEESR